MFDNASELEELWTAASLVAVVIHFWLSVQAFYDWKIADQYEPRHRVISAGWYCFGQICLFLPKVFDLLLGVLAMTWPEPLRQEIRDVQTWSQTGMILAEWISAAGAIAFWMARRALK